jgi:hypothetical protein
MQYRVLADGDGGTTYALIFDEGDEAAAELARFARETGVHGASFTGVGASSSAILGWFDFEAKAYEPNRFDEQRLRWSPPRAERPADARDHPYRDADAFAQTPVAGFAGCDDSVKRKRRLAQGWRAAGQRHRKRTSLAELAYDADIPAVAPDQRERDR